MSQYRAQTEMALSALGLFAQVAKQRNTEQSQLALAQIRSGSMAHLVDALVTQRAGVVKEGFAALLAQYAEHAQHFMTQQKQYADAEIEATDPFRRVELRSRIQKIDTELSLIRIEAKLLFTRMCEVLLMLGGSVHGFAMEFSLPLGLPADKSA